MSYKILKVHIITGTTYDTFKRYDDYLRALGEAECMQYGDDIHEYIVEKEIGTSEQRRIIGMSYVYYKSHFEFSNDNLNTDELAIVAFAYNEARRTVCDLVNPMYKIWNEEYSKKFPHIKVTDFDHEHYDKWLDAKATEFIKDRSDLHNDMIDIRFDHAGCAVYGYSKRYDTSIGLFIDGPVDEDLLYEE